jgi:hypothetical protein
MGETALITNKTGKKLLSFAALLYLGLLDCCLLMYFDGIDPLKQNGIFPILSWLKLAIMECVVKNDREPAFATITIHFLSMGYEMKGGGVPK